MEICVPKDEPIKIIYKEICPCCNHAYNSKERKKEFHHVVPKFMKPKLEIELTICKRCHEELNMFYDDNMIRKKTGGKEPDNDVNFDKFILQYRVLKKKFKDKEIERGDFGERLWKNLINHLQYIDDANCKRDGGKE